MLEEGLSLHPHICLKYRYSLEIAPLIILHIKKKRKEVITLPSKIAEWFKERRLNWCRG